MDSRARGNDKLKVRLARLRLRRGYGGRFAMTETLLLERQEHKQPRYAFPILNLPGVYQFFDF